MLNPPDRSRPDQLLARFRGLINPQVLNRNSSQPGCWLLAAGCWLLAAGCWLLAAGCWLLAAGCWP